LEEILEKLPKGVTEIDIELYHHTMGNFRGILNAVEKNCSKELADKLAFIYQNKVNYLQSADELKQEIIKLKEKFRPIKFFYIVPDFNKFYSQNVDYNKAL
jgi:hypothetical protein